MRPDQTLDNVWSSNEATVKCTALNHTVLFCSFQQGGILPDAFWVIRSLWNICFSPQCICQTNLGLDYGKQGLSWDELSLGNTPFSILIFVWFGWWEIATHYFKQKKKRKKKENVRYICRVVINFKVYSIYYRLQFM